MIAEFLTARYDEEAAIASAPGPVGWQLHRVKAPIEWRDDLGIDGESADTLVLDPARLALDVDSKRRIAELHTADSMYCGWSHDSGSTHGDFPTEVCDTLRALALPYAEHPDYRQEWKP